MRPYVFISFCLLFTQCQREVSPEKREEYVAEVLGTGGCGLPVIEFKTDREEIGAVTGYTAKIDSSQWPRYAAYNLDKQYWQSGQKLLLQVRRTKSEEQYACTTLDLAYPWITVVSARPID